ncbi:MAG: 50S ribosomal protein L1 [Acholeplasmatales bacterium]|jgi:large subunit ribosomal protein L1|nr:50S ribosomal protein L1 [Acholeplasmatales bacterium]
MFHGKKYVNVAKLVVHDKAYALSEAVDLVKKTSYVKFDATVEVAFKLNLDPKKADQKLRGASVLPHGTGKTQKVCVVAVGDKAKEASEAGADIVGDDELIAKIAGGWFEFDVLVATPDMMPKLSKLGKILGPKGLMPNPKTGTATINVGQAVRELHNGKISYDTDKAGNIHAPVGLVSFGVEQLKENIISLYQLFIKLKPTTVKGTYVKNITIASTMGPGIRINEESLR